MTEQLEFCGGLPNPREHAWMAFTLDEREEAAATAFQRRYRKAPVFVFESRGLLLCGPIPEE